MLEHTSNTQIPQIQKPTNSVDDPSSPPPAKKKRNLPGNPDPDAEVIALSPKTLLATNRFLCEICGKGFQRDQNLQLHRRGHNLPWKLRQRSSKEPRKRVYVCPEKSCVHHHPGRALGDLTGIKKHFCRKHGEKKWKCDKCSKRYAVQSDWKAHSKVCGTREYRCDCGTRFSRRDSFVTHRAFCDALAEETARVTAVSNLTGGTALAGASAGYHFLGTSSVRTNLGIPFAFPSMQYKQSLVASTMDEASPTMGHGLSLWNNAANLHHMAATTGAAATGHLFNGDPFAVQCTNSWLSSSSSNLGLELLSSSMPTAYKNVNQNIRAPSSYSGAYDRSDCHQRLPADMSATALLQKAAQIGATSSDQHHLFSYEMRCNYDDNDIVNKNYMMPTLSSFTDRNFSRSSTQSQIISKGETRDFLGVGIHSLPSSIQERWI